ncbi:hypothetical protein H0H87_012095 [Tephrocybe sp. NHM501043]|nr:hypothetical protein H0H87_012095 [Tephrocybe sp. NHM501043]
MLWTFNIRGSDIPDPKTGVPFEYDDSDAAFSGDKMPRILVTGVNGFVGSNVALELVKSGYQVRGTIRGSKLESFKNAIGNTFPTLEIVQVDDIATANLADALKGVDAIIHVAVPLPFGGSGPREKLDIAINGYVNVLRQAVKAGIAKVVITGSWASTVDATLKQAFEGHVSTEKDWSSVTEEEFLSGTHTDNLMWTYLAAKALGERAAWKFAEQETTLDLSISKSLIGHPRVVIHKLISTTVSPPFIFGPLASGFPRPAQNGLSSNQHIYTLLTGAIPPPLPPVFCDVRDVARAHVAALAVPKATSSVEDKRFLIGGGLLVWKDAVKYLHEARPQLKNRIPSLTTEFMPLPGVPTTIDATRAKVVLNMDSYYNWKETLGDTIESLLEAEKTWVKA